MDDRSSSDREQQAQPFCNSTTSDDSNNKLLKGVVIEWLVVSVTAVKEERMYLASIFTEATSLMTTPTLYPPVFCKRFCNVEVLPDPRKPLSNVIGIILLLVLSALVELLLVVVSANLLLVVLLLLLLLLVVPLLLLLLVVVRHGIVGRLPELLGT
jgi:hypothetical protein